MKKIAIGLLLLNKFGNGESGQIEEDFRPDESRITLVSHVSLESRDEIEASSLESADNLLIPSRENNFFQNFDENSLAEVVFTEEKTEIIEKSVKKASETRNKPRPSHKDSNRQPKTVPERAETVAQQGINSKLTKIEKNRISEDKSPERPDPKKTQNSSSIKDRNKSKNRKLIEEIEREIKKEKKEKMMVAIAAGIGGFFILMILLITACCISKRRRSGDNSGTLPKRRTVEANPVEQTFERLDFTTKSIGTMKRSKKAAQNQAAGDVTSSEIAPSSMGTLRTFVERSQITKTGNESDFRNTSSDIDSIESNTISNPNPKLPKSIPNMSVVSEKQTKYPGAKYGGYQELATRDQSGYSTSTGSSCDPTHPPITGVNHVTNPPPNYETINRSRDSVIDL